MNRTAIISALSVGVSLSALSLLLGSTSGWVVAISGFVFVSGGALLTAVLSEGSERLEALFRDIPTILRESSKALGEDEGVFLYITEAYRGGRVRWADFYAKNLIDPFLQQGAQLIIDGGSLEETRRVLQWRISSIKEKSKQRLQILHALAGFAPAFGMLGTLLGLAHMLFSLGDEGLAVVGASMGFALITTVYGLVIANVIIKPVAMKMERQARDELAWYHIKYELLMMLHKKDHPTLVQESLDTFVTKQDKQGFNHQAPMAVAS